MTTNEYFTEISDRFIRKYGEISNYNVNIMNQNGMIIATSKEHNRLGNFHEIAYEMIKKNIQVMEINDKEKYQGTKNGVNMLLYENGTPIGVIGITGNPDVVRNIANIIRVSMESMLEYELNREKEYIRKTTKENFINSLIRSELSNEEFVAIAKNLGYSEKYIRISLLISVDSKNVIENVLDKIKKLQTHSSQDISCILNNHHILIYKHLELNYKDFAVGYKFEIGNYLSIVLKELREKNISCKIYVGSMQKSFKYYGASYFHAKWVEKNICKKNTGLYFYDYLDEYYSSRIPFNELKNIFSVIEGSIDVKIEKNIIEIIKDLERNNYNLFESSKELFIHRNTLIFRLNKIKDYFGINPVQNKSERAFLKYFAYYLNHIKK